ncbi:MAG: hypothetical protein ACO4AI_03705, partial [Prochlorothrix sp.]
LLEQVFHLQVHPTIQQRPFLGHIARSLETMANYFAQQNPLGFREEALHRVIYCDGAAGSTWYYRDNRTQQPVLIPTPVLTCKAQHLEFVQQGDLWKLRLYVQADRLYCLEADYNSTFSKALLLALASLEKHQLQRPLSLEVLSLSGSDTLTCRVYSPSIDPSMNNLTCVASFGNRPAMGVVALCGFCLGAGL